MGTFIEDGATELPDVKVDATTPSGNTNEWAAADANKLRTALLDVRDAIQPSHFLYDDTAWVNLKIDDWAPSIIAKWGSLVDPVATAEFQADVAITDHSVGGTTNMWMTTDTSSFIVYEVYDGDDLVDFLSYDNGVLNSYRPPGLPSGYFRAPAGMVLSATGTDQHLNIIDRSRGHIYSFYCQNMAWDEGNGRLNDTGSGMSYAYDYVDLDEAKQYRAFQNRWYADATAAHAGWGMRAIGAGITTDGVTTGGTAAGTVIMPQDFTYPDGTCGHMVSMNLHEHMLNGLVFPMKFWQAQSAGRHIRCGSILRVDPTLDASAISGITDWELRIVRTWQKYGCLVRDGGTSGCGMAGQHYRADRTAGLTGDAWESILGSGYTYGVGGGGRSSNGAAFLTHFPWAYVQVLHPISNVIESV